MLLVDLMLNGQAVRVPAETPLNMEALHGPIPRDDVLDGGGEEVAIVWQASCERWSIIKGVERPAFGQLDLQRGRGELASL